MDLVNKELTVKTIVEGKLTAHQLVSIVADQGVDFALQFMKELDFQMDNETLSTRAFLYFFKEIEGVSSLIQHGDVFPVDGLEKAWETLKSLLS
jgi:hypothetical protein